LQFDVRCAAGDLRLRAANHITERCFSFTQLAHGANLGYFRQGSKALAKAAMSCVLLGSEMRLISS